MSIGTKVHHPRIAAESVRELLVLVLLMGISVRDCRAQEQVRFPVEVVREDLKFLYETLQRAHYDLFASNRREEFDREYERIQASIDEPLTAIQVNRLLQPFVALARHGHCNIEFPANSYIAYLRGGGTVFPLNLFFEEQRVRVLDNYSSDPTIIAGDEIVSINGRSMEIVLESIHRHVSGENAHSKNVQIEMLTFPRLFWIVNGACETFTLGISRAGTAVVETEVPAISGGAFEDRMGRKKAVSDPSREFAVMGDVAYLRPGAFYNVPKTGSLQISADMLDNTAFTAFLDECFAEIRESGLDDLIIDLRGNPGGASTFSNPMVAFFASEPFIGGSSLSIRVSEHNKAFWKDVEITSPIMTAIKEGVLSGDNGSRFDVPLEDFKHQPRDDDLRFDGDVFVLINRFSFSEAIVISAMIQDCGFGTLIGEQTSPVNFGNARQFKLPATGMTVTFPAAHFVRVNGDASIEGTLPDLWVSGDPLTEADEMLEYALNMIRES